MRWMLRAVVTAVLLVAAAFAVTACGSSDDSSEGSSTTSSASATTGAKAGTKITLWHNSADPPRAETAVQRLRGRHRHRARGGRQPVGRLRGHDADEMGLGLPSRRARVPPDRHQPARAQPESELARPLRRGVHREVRRPLQKRRDRRRQDLRRGHRLPAGLRHLLQQGRLRESGIDTPPTNAAELIEACRTILARAPGVTPIAESGGSQWPVQVLPTLLMGDANPDNTWGQELRSNRAHLDDDGSPFTRAMETYKQLRDDGCFNRTPPPRRSRTRSEGSSRARSRWSPCTPT